MFSKCAKHNWRIYVACCVIAVSGSLVPGSRAGFGCLYKFSQSAHDYV